MFQINVLCFRYMYYVLDKCIVFRTYGLLPNFILLSQHSIAEELIFWKPPYLTRIYSGFSQPSETMIHFPNI